LPARYLTALEGCATIHIETFFKAVSDDAVEIGRGKRPQPKARRQSDSLEK
jgi:hypothetical protein